MRFRQLILKIAVSAGPELSALPWSARRFTLIVACVASLMASCADWLRAQQTSESSASIKVAVYEGTGVGKSVANVISDLKTDSAIDVVRISPDQILKDELQFFDVVIFPGGSGGGQAKSLGPDGREKVRGFVRNGGGYIGICAGAYLASADYDWSLHILDAKVLDRSHWDRGFGDVELKVTDEGQSKLSLPSSRTTLYYHQGPLLAPAESPDLDDYEEWASFETEVKKEGVPGGVMPGKTAIAAGSFGTGRVLAISPHPERTEGLDSVVPSAVRWVAKQQVHQAPDAPDLVISQLGDLPVVISAPHGGTLQIPNVEPRKGDSLEVGPAGYRVVRDGGTEEFALEVVRQLADRMQGRPSFVISRVHRRYVDFNRPPNIAVEDPRARVVYDQYHEALSNAVRTIREKYKTGLLIDLHGQGASAVTAYRGTSNGLTVSAMKARHDESFLSGPRSLSGLLKEHGWNVHPDPFDGKEKAGYTGGFIVRTYGSHQSNGIDAIQWELGADYRKAAVRERRAKEMADSIAEYFESIQTADTHAE